MTKAELIEALKNIPDTAIVYVESDHGQTPERVGHIFYTTEQPATYPKKELPYYGDNLDWHEKAPYPSIVTAVKIG